MILSLFCGCGGLDLGFEQAGYKAGLAYDIRKEAVSSWNENRGKPIRGYVDDISKLKLADLDRDFGSKFEPVGVIGGPPCQSFSRANSGRSEDDPRSLLIETFVSLALSLHQHRKPLDFIVMENVSELVEAKAGKLLAEQIARLDKAGFDVETAILNAADYGVPQYRRRMFLVALRRSSMLGKKWQSPAKVEGLKTVAHVLADLPEPMRFSRDIDQSSIPEHPNHWCMVPKSPRFFDGSLTPGYSAGRSFKTLSWERPSITVSYGHREVHVHPDGRRRLSVYEAMKLQGFPDDYVLQGTLSSQITQVSEAVPPPLANAVAQSIKELFEADVTQPLPGQSYLSSCSSTDAA